MLAQTRRGDIALGADHRAQRLTLRGLHQAGDLPANAFERQPGALRKALDLGGTGQHHHRSAGEQAFTVPGLPLAIDLAQLHGIVMRQ
ncbi:hypothetical protein D3C87_1281010 [compost metagenome]